MFLETFIYFMLFHLVTNQIQINLDRIDVINSSRNNDALQHDCLHVATRIITRFEEYQIISYCMSEWPSKWNIQTNRYDRSFTFAELAKRNITSQQLYHWSAPMDIVENYQFHLDQSSNSTQLFYNCTLPNFGPFCQYSLDIPMSNYTSINDIIDNFYKQMYEPTTMTCYIHLPCNRGSTLSCLDWTEICDGKIDCLNDGIDEEHCWQLEVNECAENEYRCNDGQCIEKTYVNETYGHFDCVDQSDQRRTFTRHDIMFASGPTFLYEDIRCPDYAWSDITFTSSCVYQRHQLIFEAMFLNKPDSISDECWFAFRCYFKIPDSLHSKCRDIYENETSKQIINKSCPDIFFIPNVPILFGHIYFVYTKKAALESTNRTLPPSYICYDHRLCGGFSPNKTLLLLNNSTCRRPEDFPVVFSKSNNANWQDTYLKPIFKQLYKCRTPIYNHSLVCNNSLMYQCINSSKCITRYRIGDGLLDCDYGDDEDEKVIYDICLKYHPRTLFQCTTTAKCIRHQMVENGDCNCGCDEGMFCDDELLEFNKLRRRVSFRDICDGITGLVPIMVDGRNETDEMECEFWQCNNTYTRCNGNWNCLNGADEVDCNVSPLQCPLHHHTCISIETNQPICLPIGKANDGKIDCLEGADEPKYCQSNCDSHNTDNINCLNYTSITSIKCTQFSFFNPLCYRPDFQQYCYKPYNYIGYDSLCNEKGRRKRLSYEHQLSTVQFPMNDNKNLEVKIQFSSRVNNVIKYEHRCHRGIPLRVWIDREKNRTATTCLCPPSFYGETCQYQNERVSVTLKFRVQSDSMQTVFAIVVSLIDDSQERTIHSSEQFSHLYIRDCEDKFKIYLLYSTRPKNSTKNYFVHIDVYEKISLTYRVSFLLPLKFPFLPVQRIVTYLTIPETNENIRKCIHQPCIHGQCRRYSEDRNGRMFCHCNQGWSGQYCHIPHTCTCSFDSLCIGMTASNRSICVCPLDKIGSRCSLHHTICQSNRNDTCSNGGQCISVDQDTPSNKKFFCICPKGFTGYRCEISHAKIIVSFHKDMQLSGSMIVHFVQTARYVIPEIGSTFQTISIYQKVVTLYWGKAFNLVLMQLFNKDLYMFVNPHIYNLSAILEVAINSSDRCKHISEVLDETIVNLHLIRRIKYYHVPCQSPFLPCFYDDDYFCMCNNFGHHRVADCHEFNPRQKHDCFGNNYCENNGQCLQDKQICPLASLCLCPDCFYGTRCQFSSSLFGLSLDAILGYHIQPHISPNQQPSIIQFSLALTILMILAGWLNGILSLLTFKNQEPEDVGCDLYLFGSSITILFTMIMFTLKFWILLAAQITYNMNRTFLSFQCILFDFLLLIGLNMDQWLCACIAVERAVMMTKGIHFNQKKSKTIARYIIFSLLFFTTITTIHDPIHRKLIDDGNEQRIWCVVNYSSSIQIYNSIINIFHFIVPFGVNILSAITIIRTTTRLRNQIVPQQGYQQILQIQIRRHSRILIAPMVLIIFTTPRLILSLVSGCMRSIDDAWIFLIGYYVSFLPPMLTFLVFVLPSKTYKKKFWKSMRQFRILLQTRLHLNIGL